MQLLEIGKGRIVRESTKKKSAKNKVAILNFGTLLNRSIAAADALDATVADMRFVKPLDEELTKQLASLPDSYVDQGTQDSLLQQVGLDKDGIEASIQAYLKG